MENIKVFKTESVEFKNGEKYFLYDEETGKSLSPIVDKITYDEEHDCFLLIDSVDEGFIKLYFYMDKEGNVLGTGFTNIDNRMLHISVSSDNDTYICETYYELKKELLSWFEKNFNKTVNDNIKNALKMVEHQRRLRKIK